MRPRAKGLSKNNLSSHELGRALGVTQKSGLVHVPLHPERYGHRLVRALQRHQLARLGAGSLGRR